MLIRNSTDIRPHEITSETLFRNRRQFMKTTGGAMVAGLLGGAGVVEGARQLGRYDVDEKPAPFDAVTGHNNFYEFGTDYGDAARNAHTLRPSPWTVEVDGLVRNPKTWDLDDLLRGITMEDRIYRMRCVEGWSMVIPWFGFPMEKLITRLDPLPGAAYVRMETLVDPEQMPGQRRRGLLGSALPWPYVEGLRMDEAMHPLTLMAVGVYGKRGPNQNGAPIRLAVPWKYGFKGVKSIVRIRFVEDQPLTTWQREWPEAYGFYANVNPFVDHPRFSQSTERRIGEFFQRPTLPFNGYAEHVEHLYDGMDLRRYY